MHELTLHSEQQEIVTSNSCALLRLYARPEACISITRLERNTQHVFRVDGAGWQADVDTCPQPGKEVLLVRLNL